MILSLLLFLPILFFVGSGKIEVGEKSSWGVEHCALAFKLLIDSQWIYDVEMIYSSFALIVFNVELLCCLEKNANTINILDKTIQNYMLIVKYMKISERCAKFPAVQSSKLLGSLHI